MTWQQYSIDRNNLRKLKYFPLYPFLFAVYAVLGVYATNANEIPVSQIIRPIVIILIFTGLIFTVIFRLVKNPDRAGFITTLILLWFFYFGHIFFFVPFFPILKGIPAKLIVTALAWGGLLFAFGSNKFWHLLSNPHLITTTLNIVAAIVVVLPLVSTAYVAIETQKQQKVISAEQSSYPIPELTSSEINPDIYYIILDGYGRNDVLSEYYGYENSLFTNRLKEKGFFIADVATSNYMQTELSLSSILNLRYLDFLTDGMGNSQNRGPLNNLIRDSVVRKALEFAGYNFVALASNVLFTQISNADAYLPYSRNSISELEGLLISKTILGAFVDDLGLDLPLPNYATHRRIINNNFEVIRNLPISDEPMFIFMHILAPHPPFVFNSTGEPIQPNRPYFIGDATGFLGDQEEYIKGYTDEIEYINNQVTTMVDDILEITNGNAIIIIHGDHGPGAFTSFIDPERSCLKERFSVLLAIYFPSKEYSSLKGDMSLVNLFPAIFNSNFQTNIPLLENRHYFAPWSQPYKFIDVTSELLEDCTIEAIPNEQ